jgi:hypothetical protein
LQGTTPEDAYGELSIKYSDPSSTKAPASTTIATSVAPWRYLKLRYNGDISMEIKQDLLYFDIDKMIPVYVYSNFYADHPKVGITSCPALAKPAIHTLSDLITFWDSLKVVTFVNWRTDQWFKGTMSLTSALNEPLRMKQTEFSISASLLLPDNPAVKDAGLETSAGDKPTLSLCAIGDPSAPSWKLIMQTDVMSGSELAHSVVILEPDADSLLKVDGSRAVSQNLHLEGYGQPFDQQFREIAEFTAHLHSVSLEIFRNV